MSPKRYMREEGKEGKGEKGKGDLSVFHDAKRVEAGIFQLTTAADAADF